MTVAELYHRDHQFWAELGVAATAVPTAPVQALQYTGTPESAEAIATTFGLTVDAQFDRVVVLVVPAGWTIAVDDYDRDNRAFGVVIGGWVWKDSDNRTIGAEWDDYFRHHFTATTTAGHVDVPSPDAT